MAPTLKQSYAYANLLVRFFAQLADQYLYVLVTPVETIAYHPLNTVQSQHLQHRCAEILDVLFDACWHQKLSHAGMQLPIWRLFCMEEHGYLKLLQVLTGIPLHFYPATPQLTPHGHYRAMTFRERLLTLAHISTFLTTQGHGGSLRMRNQLNAGATSEATRT